MATFLRFYTSPTAAVLAILLIGAIIFLSTIATPAAAIPSPTS